MKKDQMVVIDYNDYLMERYVNSKIIFGTLICKKTEYLDDWDEHDHGTEIYTVLGTDKKIYKGASFTGYGYDYVIMPASKYLKEIKSHIEILKSNKESLLKEVKNLEKLISNTQKELDSYEGKIYTKTRK